MHAGPVASCRVTRVRCGSPGKGLRDAQAVADILIRPTRAGRRPPARRSRGHAAQHPGCPRRLRRDNRRDGASAHRGRQHPQLRPTQAGPARASHRRRHDRHGHRAGRQDRRLQPAHIGAAPLQHVLAPDQRPRRGGHRRTRRSSQPGCQRVARESSGKTTPHTTIVSGPGRRRREPQAPELKRTGESPQKKSEPASKTRGRASRRRLHRPARPRLPGGWFEAAPGGAMRRPGRRAAPAISRSVACYASCVTTDLVSR